MNKELLDDLQQWLNRKRIQYSISEDVLSIDGFGDMLIFDTDKVSSVFKKVKGSDEVLFNNYEMTDELIAEGINFACLKFGLNWYYVDLREQPDLRILQCIGTKVQCSRHERIVNLGVHTSYELLNSSVHIEELVAYSEWFGHSYVGICDVNTMASTYPLQKACKRLNYVFGYSTTVDYEGVKFGCKMYAKNHDGLQSMLRIQKVINVDRLDGQISIEELKQYTDGLFFVFAKDSIPVILGDYGKQIVSDVFDMYGDESVFYQFDVSEYRTDMLDVEMLNNAKRYIREIYMNDQAAFIPPVLLTDIYYLDADDAKSKLILNKIGTGGAHSQSFDHYFKDVDDHYSQIHPLFSAMESEGFEFDPFFEYICENSVYIAESCNAKFDNNRMYMPVYSMTDEEIKKYGDRLNMFDSIIEEGFERLVPKDKVDIYRDRVEKEKYVLKSTDSVDYFLIYYDLCKWSRENDILTAYGRGSAGGSLVSYLMGIIKIDPLKYDLIFERFLIPERAGLNEEQVTFLSEPKSNNGFIITLENGKSIIVDDQSKIIVNRSGEHIEVTMSELENGDDIVFDNNDKLWSIEYENNKYTEN